MTITIKDASGAPVEGATVIAVHQGTNAITETASVADGTATFAGLTVGEAYEVYAVTAGGLTSQVRVITVPSVVTTFAATLNDTGDPIGGGPGYTGAYRTNTLGLTGQGIYTKADVQTLVSGGTGHIITTEAELQAVAKSYRRRTSVGSLTFQASDTVGGGAATSGHVVWIEGNVSRVLELRDAVGYDFNSGVTVCSDFGDNIGGGTYSWGTTIRIPDRWLDFKTHFAFKMTSSWRLTGLIVEGPSPWGGVTNVGYTDSFLGESSGIYASTATGVHPEVDNVWFLGFSYMAINGYQGPNYIHHGRSFYNAREGYGYGIYPGRDANTSDTLVTKQSYVGWHIHGCRHATDMSGGASWSGANHVMADRAHHDWRSIIITGDARAALLNHHAVEPTLGKAAAAYSNATRSSIDLDSWKFDTPANFPIKIGGVYAYTTSVQATSAGPVTVAIHNGAGGAVAGVTTVTGSSATPIETTTQYGAFRCNYEKVAVMDDRSLNEAVFQVGWAPPNTEGSNPHLIINNIWSYHAAPLEKSNLQSQNASLQFSTYLADVAANTPLLTGPTTIDSSTIYGSGTNQVAPVPNCTFQ